MHGRSGFAVLLMAQLCSGLMLAGTASAQNGGEIVEADVERRELDIAKVDTENFELTGFIGYMNVEDFDSDVVWGARFAFHLTPALFTEISYGKVDTGRSSSERATGVDPIAGSSSELEYYDISLGWNVLPGEVFVGPGKAWNSAFYLIGGIGNAELADEDETALNLGFGFRVLPTDGFSVRLDFRNYIFDTEATGDEKTTNNLQATLNLGWYF
jgi:outer membrane beta-barrel protein